MYCNVQECCAETAEGVKVAQVRMGKHSDPAFPCETQ